MRYLYQVTKGFGIIAPEFFLDYTENGCFTSISNFFVAKKVSLDNFNNVHIYGS
jgi:hypothetical protein